MSSLFTQITLIGAGLINSSLACAIRAQQLAQRIVISDNNPENLAQAERLGLADAYLSSNAAAVLGSDLVVLGVPLLAMETIAAEIAPALAQGAIVTDVGSVKQCVVSAMQPHLPTHVHFIPGHPIAGTENSGPAAGFAELFRDRFCILTPLANTDAVALDKLKQFWTATGAIVEQMDAQHHDQVLAITSHLPHLIAYTIVGTANALADDLEQEVIRYSASGFRDFTRIAASDPTMWRDVFLTNRDAVLDILQRFNEDLTHLQRAIRANDAETLFTWFSRTRAIRRSIIAVRQHVPEDQKQQQLRAQSS